MSDGSGLDVSGEQPGSPATHAEVRTWVDLLRLRTGEAPDRETYTFLKFAPDCAETLTNQELDRRARMIAVALGDCAGQKVLLLFPPGLDYLSAFFGCLYAGAVAVPAYPPNPNRMHRSMPRVMGMIEDADIRFVLTTDVIAASQQRLHGELPRLAEMRWLSVDTLDISLAKQWTPPAIDGNTLAFLQYTSGSTSTPKGVMVTHANLLHNESTIQKGFGTGADDRVVSWLPMYHDMGLIGSILHPLFLGARCYYMAPMDFLRRPYRWLEAIHRYQATVSGGPNFAYDLCVEKIPESDRARLDLSSWQVAFNGAEPVRAETLDAFCEAFAANGFKRTALYPCYGLAEATLFVSGPPRQEAPRFLTIASRRLEEGDALGPEEEDDAVQTFVSNGPCFHDVRIVDPVHCTVQDESRVGEIWIKSPSVAGGYLGKPIVSASIFAARLAESDEGPFLRTGDLGFFRDGELYVTGRQKDLIIIRGRNLYPQDIERTVELSGLTDLISSGGAAFSADVDGEERLVVVWEVTRRPKTDLVQIIDTIRELIAEHHEIQPHAVVLIRSATIPKTSSGKIRRSATKQRFLDEELSTVHISQTEKRPMPEKREPTAAVGQVLQTAGSEQGNALRRYLRDKLGDILGMDPDTLPENKPLTSLGLDSISAVELQHAVETDLDRVLPMTDFLDGLNLMEAAEEIGRVLAEGSGEPALAPVGAPLGRHPLSHGQRALWFLSHLQSDSAAYNIARAVRLPRALDEAALIGALEAWMSRHPMLRTTFGFQQGEPFQEVHRELALPLQIIDSGDWPEDQLRSHLADLAHQPFGEGALLRLFRYLRDDEGDVLLMVVHHAIADFWSLALLMHELGQSYSALRVGRKAMADVAPLGFVDYVQWQDELLAGPRGDALWQFWRKTLPPNPEALHLPTDRPRPKEMTENGAVQHAALEGETIQRLDALAQDLGATRFAVLLTVWQVLLCRYSGRYDIITGAPGMGRGRAGLADLVGYFVNPVPIRADLTGNPSFREAVGRVRQASLDAFAHADFPFPLLVERLQPERDPSFSPIFQNMLVYQSNPPGAGEGIGAFALGEDGAPMELGALHLESVAIEQRVTQFDLTLVAGETAPNRLALALEYNTDLFDPHSIERLLTHLHLLLDGVTAAPDAGIQSVNLLPESERDLILNRWNRTHLETPRNKGVCHLFEEETQVHPDRIALIYNNRHITYAELDRRANQLAHALIDKKMNSGGPIGVCLPRCDDMVIAVLGIFKAGGGYVPLDPSHPADRQRYIAEDAGVRMLLAHRATADNWLDHDIEIMYLDEPENLAHYPATRPDVWWDPMEACYLIYTSGSTGRPKGVTVSHGALMNTIASMYVRPGIGPGERLLAVITLAFDMAAFELYLTLAYGGTLVMAPQSATVDGFQLAKLVEDSDITLMQATPATWQMLFATGWKGKPDLRAITGGEALSVDLARKMTNGFQEVWDQYGPTEAAIYGTRARVYPGETLNIGSPIHNARTYILDKLGNPVPIGVPGELYLAGAGLARGYWKRPGLTASVFLPNPFSKGQRMYRTGDLVRYFNDGRIQYLGRLDHQVKIRGFRIELGEIETELTHLYTVKTAVVVAYEARPGNRRLAAYVVMEDGEAENETALRNQLSRNLPDYMVPADFVFLAEMPLTPNGKVDRRALPEPEQSVETLEYVAPHNWIESQLAVIWSEVLGLEKVSVNAGFFELGGHSLLATQVVSRIREAFSVELPLRRLFSAPTISALSREIEEQLGTSPDPMMGPIDPMPAGATPVLSFAQERLFFFNQMAVQDAAAGWDEQVTYNMAAALRLRGPLDIQALEAAMDQVIARHATLRCAFPAPDGVPTITVAPHVAWHLPVVMVQDETQIQALANAEMLRPFDLENGPLFRMTLLRLGADDAVMVVNMHHIISDGWSVKVLIGELAALYPAALNKSSLDDLLPKLPVSYTDFAAWQRSRLRGPYLKERLDHWTQVLADTDHFLELPTDRPRPAMRTFRGRVLHAQMDSNLTTALAERAQAEEATLFMILQATFGVLMSRYSGQDDFVIGSPIANRDRAEIEPLIGFFVNTLALRCDLRGDPAFDTFLSRTRQFALDAFMHQDVPFDRVVEAVKPERNMAHSPLFQVMFILQNAPGDALALPGLDAAFIKSDQAPAKFDLTLVLERDADGLQAAWEYNADLFDQQTIERMHQHYLVLLQAVTENSACRIDRLPLMSAEERHQVLVTWNTGKPLPICERGIHRSIREQAGRTPDATALTTIKEKGIAYSYAQLDRTVSRLAVHLQGLGAVPESVVGLYLERSPEMAVAILAVLAAGSAYMPLDPAHPADRIAYMLADTHASIILTTRELLSTLPPHEGKVVLLGEGAVFEGMSELPEDTEPVELAAADNLAYILYTSGSTGTPKGVAVSHRAIGNRLHWARRAFPLTPDDCFLQVASFNFDISLWELFAPLMTGARSLLAPPEAYRDPGFLRAMIHEEGVTVAHFVPSVLEALLEGEDRAWATHLRLVFCGGEAPAKDLPNRFFKAVGGELHQFYGPTEGAINATSIDCRDILTHGASVIGQPIDNVKIYVLDHYGRPVPAGVHGELCIAGVALARGYHGQPALTARHFVPDALSGEHGTRAYRTGDKVCYLPDGKLKFLGRIDHQVKIRGFRVEPDGIAEVLRKHPAVIDSVVVCREDRPGDKRLVAYLQVPGAELGAVDETEVRLWVKTLLPEYMVPSLFVFMDELPRNANGKLDRKALPDPDMTRDDYVPPRDKLEADLVTIWAEILDLEQIGIEDNFFELGGHSLMATRVSTRIEAAFSLTMPVRQLFVSPTIAGLAEWIRQGEHGVHRPAIEALAPGTQAPLSFAQQRMWLLEQMDAGNPAYHMPADLRLDGPLCLTTLERALTVLAQRQISLRTLVLEEDNERFQAVAEGKQIHVSFVDLSDHAPDTADALARAAHARPFNLVEGPLWRVILFRMSHNRHRAAVTMHHIISDGWSVGVFIRELSALYNAALKHDDDTLIEAAGLPQLEVHYTDFAAWQRQWLSGPVLDSQLAYWTHNLAEIAGLLELPLDKPRPKLQTFSGESLNFRLSAELTKAFEAYSKEQGVTLFMTLETVFALLLSRYSGEDDVLVGTPVANRNMPAIEPLIGFFVNTLVLRNDFSGNPSFNKMVARTAQTALDAYAHQDLPFERVVEAVVPERQLSYNPVFQVMFILQNAPESTLALEGLDVHLREAERTHAKFDITLELNRNGDRLDALLEYNTDLFHRHTMERLIHHFQTLASALMAAPERPVGRASLLGEQERERILEDWNKTYAPYPSGRTIADLFIESVKQHKDREALVWCSPDGDVVRLTYLELTTLVNRMAGWLRDSGVGPDAPVGICMDRTVEMIVAMLAVQRAGGAYVPMDPVYPRERIAYTVKDAGLRVMLSQQSMLAMLPDTTRKIALDAPDAMWRRAPDLPVKSTSRPENLSHIIYTSGSTGLPKGVAIRHRGSVAMIAWMGHTYKPEHLAGVLAGTSICFDLSVYEIMGTLVHGGTIYLGENALSLAGMPVANEVTLINTVPSAMTELLNLQKVPDTVRIVNLAGEPLRGELVQRIYDLGHVEAVYNLYGPSEDTTYSTWARIPQGEAYPPIGRPLSNTRAFLLDKGGRPVPVGHNGELYLAGDGLARGYYGKPALTAERFVPNPFGKKPGSRLYRTGDLVHYLANGDMIFTGRVDHQVKLRGFRIELGEIEVALRKDVRVQDAVVVVREDTPGDQRLAAYVTPATAPRDDLDEVLRAGLVTHLPGYMVPGVIVVLDEMPLTPNGKINRAALPVPGQAGIRNQSTPPTTRLETELVHIWSDILKMAHLGIHDNFFDLGGHSLSATRVVSRIREDYGLDLPLKTVFQTGTIARLAEVVEEGLITPGERTDDLIPQLPRDGSQELSFAQSRLWFLSRMAHPDSQGQENAYNIPILLRLKGVLDKDRLAGALNRIAERHESLRTHFTERDGKAVQIVADYAPQTLHLHDLTEEDDPTSLALSTAEAATRQAFDLEHGPLWRAQLWRLAEEEHLLLVEQHHIISDGWSLGVLTQELTAFYAEEDLPPLPVQYPDFAGWQQERLRRGALNYQLRYWQHDLAGVPELLELPLDRPRPPVQTFVGAAYRHRYAPAVISRFAALCTERGATLFMGLEALFAHLLGRWSNTEDVVVGSPIANRNRADLEPMIGFFVNTLPLRNDLSGDPSFPVLLERTRLMALEAFAHQDIPFERVVEALQLKRSLSHTPVFQVIFALQNAPRDDLSLPGLTIDRIDLPIRTAKFDFTFILFEQDGGLELSLEYNTDLFEESAMRRLAQHFGNLLDQAPHHGDAPLSQLNLMSDEERDRVLHLWNQTETEDREQGRLHGNIAAFAAHNPEAEALVFIDESGSQRLTYAQLVGRANQVAHRLRGMGFGPESIVGVCIERSPEMVIAMLGALQAGAAYLPIDPTYPADRIAYMVEDSGTQVLLTSTKVTLNTTVTHIPVDDPASVEGMPDDAPDVRLHADNLAYVIYTSGSTGRPKGTYLTHRGFYNEITECIRFLQVRPGHRWLQFASFSFDASVLETFSALGAGAALYLAPRNLLLPGPILQEFMVNNAITHTLLSPTAVSHLDETQLTSLTTLAVGGEASSAGLVNRFVKDRRMVNAYGPTEATIAATMFELSETERNPPIGGPLGNYRTYVLDRSARPVPIGVPGELYVGGIGVARGYLGRPGLTADRFLPDPFSGDAGGRLYRTGDLVRFTGEDAEARIEYLGRIDHQVKLRGFRIELGEIESVLTGHPMVRESVVLVREDRPGDQRLTGYAVLGVQPEEGHDPIPGIRNYLKERLPEFMVPPTLMALDSLPMTPGGKVDRKRLPIPDQSALRADYVAASGNTERTIEAAWCEVLNMEKVGVHDNFFEIGGHSILVVELHGKLQTALNRQFALVRLFEHPTISSLAAWLDQAAEATDEEKAKEALERGSSRREALKSRKRRRRR